MSACGGMGGARRDGGQWLLTGYVPAAAATGTDTVHPAVAAWLHDTWQTVSGPERVLITFPATNGLWRVMLPVARRL